MPSVMNTSVLKEKSLSIGEYIDTVSRWYSEQVLKIVRFAH